MRYEAHKMNLEPGEEIWVQSFERDEFEVGIQFTKDQYTYLTLNRAQLEQLSTNVLSALLETDY